MVGLKNIKIKSGKIKNGQNHSISFADFQAYYFERNVSLIIDDLIKKLKKRKIYFLFCLNQKLVEIPMENNICVVKSK